MLDMQENQFEKIELALEGDNEFEKLKEQIKKLQSYLESQKRN